MRAFGISRLIVWVLLAMLIWAENSPAGEDLHRALKRAQYLLNTTVSTQADYDLVRDVPTYRAAVRRFLDHDNFYAAMLRYHETLFGVGLPTDYIDELLREDIDNKTNKFAQIMCSNDGGADKLRCQWASARDRDKVSSCPVDWQEPVSIFWYPGLVAWVCPSIVRACGNDLSRCFIEFEDEFVAANSELGTTEAFDSRFSVVKSLSKQPAGIATAVAVGNYPYTTILEPGLTAVDGAIAHFYRQNHHFDLAKLHLPQELIDVVETIPLTDTNFHLVYTGNTYEQAGVLTTFGWLRRYEKNRTRANQLYERLLCRQFTSELPRIFPQDPGNLRETPGCSGCHATLDPLADFFAAWGEGGDLYQGFGSVVSTSFGGQSGAHLADLANIIRNDNAFATCSVQNAWSWLMGREFFASEADLRAALTNYFIEVRYSFKELLYAIATHSAFTEGTRTDAIVTDPLTEPPLGEPPGGNDLPPCDTPIDFATDIEPRLTLCTGCHAATPVGGANTDLSTEAQWQQWASQALNFMASGQMPPSGQSGPPRIGPVFELKEAVRCWVERNSQ